MKKTKGLKVLFGGIFLILLAACQPKSSPKAEETNALEHKDSLSEEKIEAGQIPENWEKIDLGKGYYIAFPEKPNKRTLKSRKRIEYNFSNEDYILYCSHTDLEKEPLLNQERGAKGLFYDAVLKDLMEELAETSESGALPQLVLKESFLFLNIYEAMRAELRAEDFLMELKIVAIGKKLFTTAFVLFEEPEADKAEALQTIKKEFFQSFGKELYVEY